MSSSGSIFSCAGIGIQLGIASNPLSASASDLISNRPVFHRCLSGGKPLWATPSPHFWALYCEAAFLLSGSIPDGGAYGSDSRSLFSYP